MSNFYTGYQPISSCQQVLLETNPQRSADASHRWTIVTGLPASGKTYGGMAWAIDRALSFPKEIGLIVSSSFPFATHSMIPALQEVCGAFQVPLEPYRVSRDEQTRAIALAQYCRVGEQRALIQIATSWRQVQPLAIIGMKVRWVLIDDADHLPEQTFKNIEECLNGRGSLPAQGVMTSSSNLPQWLSDRLEAQPELFNRI